MDRVLTEQVFHDRQAQGRADAFLREPSRFVFDDDAYLDHETWIRPAFELLGDLRGKRVLDFGCGHGMAAVVLSRRGAEVVAFDLSRQYLREAESRSSANDRSVQFLAANGERLPFADGSFDGVWGNAVLHHLDIDRAGHELHRILRPGGVAVFCEPWGENPLLNLARRFLPYPGKQRTPDEEPIRRPDVDRLKIIFPKVETQGFQLLSMVRRYPLSGWLTQSLSRIDHCLLCRFSFLHRFCRYMVLTLRRS